MAGGHPLLTGGLTTPKKATRSPQLGTSQGGAAMSLVRGAGLKQGPGLLMPEGQTLWLVLALVYRSHVL